MKVNIPYGNKELELQLAASKIAQALEPLPTPTLDYHTCKESIERAIVEMVPSCSSFTIIVPDITRMWTRSSLFTSQVVDVLSRLGIKAERITVLIATGSHDGATKEEIITIVGKDVAEKVKIINHNCYDDKDLVYWGETSYKNRVYLNTAVFNTDCIIIVGGVMFHLIAGFGGGRKYILPGIAGYDTIQTNHSLSILPDGTPHPNVKPSLLVGNPVNDDMIEGAGFLLKRKKSLLINIVDNGYGKLSYITVGNWYSSWQEACHFVEKFYKVKIPSLGDFAIVSPGGYTKDAVLYQSVKALFNAALCVKRGGQIIFVTQCRYGIGNEEFASALVEFKKKPKLLGEHLTKRFSMAKYVAYSVLNLVEKFNITLISDIPSSSIEELGFKHSDDLGSLINSLQGKGYIIPFGENVLPYPETTDLSR
ncbi:MAG: nickel-dependent lactate racemase [Synergistetes bacterium]|nr:nickel-dependent lactate racemase [Synergistota bacterium]